MNANVNMTEIEVGLILQSCNDSLSKGEQDG